jgi:hypothetical protein
MEANNQQDKTFFNLIKQGRIYAVAEVRGKVHNCRYGGGPKFNSDYSCSFRRVRNFVQTGSWVHPT